MDGEEDADVEDDRRGTSTKQLCASLVLLYTNLASLSKRVFKNLGKRIVDGPILSCLDLDCIYHVTLYHDNSGSIHQHQPQNECVFYKATVILFSICVCKRELRCLANGERSRKLNDIKRWRCCDEEDGIKDTQDLSHKFCLCLSCFFHSKNYQHPFRLDIH